MSSLYESISDVWQNDIRFLEALSELSGLHTALWLTGQPVGDISWTSCGHVHPCFTHEPLRQALEQCSSSGEPGIFLESDHFVYGVIPVGPFSIAVGPSSLWTLPETSVKDYLAGHGIEESFPIPRKELGVISHSLELISLHFKGTAPAHEEIPVTADILEKWQRNGDLEQYQLDQSENDRSHRVGIDFENSLLQVVAKGDTAAMKSLLSGPSPDYAMIGQLSKEEIKDLEYLSVTVIALMTRAAVAGGARAEDAHDLGDVYLKKLAKAALNKESFTGLSYSAMIEFTEMVRRAKAEKSSLSAVEACKEYIEQNLRKNIKVSDIAPAIGLSRTYLSRLFHQAEGITVQQYIQREKCRHAASMLRYSDYTISDISQYFGFSTQSYFGSCFQAWYGMSPNAYRKTNH